MALYKEMRDCHDCPLAGSRTNLVFGAGNADAELMFVGEAPGRFEDEQGLPFVGRAGQLLDELLREVGLERKDVFITNTLKCRPPGNRDPLPEEIEACKPYLYRQIELIQPRVVCTLGNFATKLLTRSNRGIMSVRGRPQVHELGGRRVRLYPLCHPAAALRTPATLEALRQDIGRLPELVAEPPLESPGGSRAAPEPPEAAAAAQMDLFA